MLISVIFWNASDSLPLILIVGTFFIAVYIKVAYDDKREVKKKLNDEQFENKLRHKNFIASVKENFPAFQLDNAILDRVNVSLYNIAEGSRHLDRIGEFRVSGQLRDNNYHIVVEIMIITKHFKKEASAIENDYEILLFHTATLMDLLLKEDQVNNAMIAAFL